MKLLVVYDKEGTILGLGPAVPSTRKRKTVVGKELPAPTLSKHHKPRLLPGQLSAVLEVPDAYSKLSLLEIHAKLRVNISGEAGLVSK